MFRTIQGVVVVLLVLAIDVTAVVVAVADDKVSNLLIGTAMVASSALIFGVMVDRRLGDAYDSGRRRAFGVQGRAGGHNGG